LVYIFSSAETVSFFGSAVSFGRFKKIKTAAYGRFRFLWFQMLIMRNKFRELENGRLSDWYCIATDTGCIVSNRIGYSCIRENPILRASLHVWQLLTDRVTQDDVAPRHPPRVNAVWWFMIREGV